MLNRTLRIVVPIVVLVGACSLLTFLVHRLTDGGGSGGPSGPPEPPVALATFGAQGGMCSDGKQCRSEHRLMDDGTIRPAGRLTEAELEQAQGLLTVLGAADYSKADLTDCGESAHDGQDPYIELPALEASLEPCQQLPPEAELAYDELLTLLQGASSG